MSYLSSGPATGPLIIFIHGWPGLASTWAPQITAFSKLGFHCIAADTLGYGQTTVSHTVSDYSCENLANDQLALLSHLDQPSAIWAAHDWGTGPMYTLAAHHPSVCTAIIGLCVPYRTLEVGLNELLTTVNRSIYPSDLYPNGQWDYQAYYEQAPAAATKQFEDGGEKALKLVFSNGFPETFGKPTTRTAEVCKNKGWFGGLSANALPDVPVEKTSLNPELYPGMYEELTSSLKRTGWFGATAYYLNHAANEAYNRDPPGGGVLEMPVLFVHAKYDSVCATAVEPEQGEKGLMTEMRAKCKEMEEVVVEAGHWVGLEKAEEVNRAMVSWVQSKGLGKAEGASKGML